MKKIFYIFPIQIMAGLLFYPAAWRNTATAKSVEINVESSASTGGNTINGSGSIKTGSATAKSSVETEVNFDSSSQVEVSAEAEANGNKIEISEESSGEEIDIHEEKSNDGATLVADLEINQIDAAGDKSVMQEKGIINSVKDSLDSFIDKIISWFNN